MSDKIARLGIERDNDMMYYIKNGDVWAVPRKQKGQLKGRAQKVAAAGLEMDYSRYIYFLDKDGDVARKERALGGRSKTKPAKAAKASKPTKSKSTAIAPVAKKSGTKSGTKSEAQLDREIEECLAKAKKPSSNGAGTKKRKG